MSSNAGLTAAAVCAHAADRVTPAAMHPTGGPYVFIVEQQDSDLQMHPVVKVADAAAFAPTRVPDYVQPFTAQYWGLLQAIVRDPDGRSISLEAPDPNASAHHG
jgi:hypothetical protein